MARLSFLLIITAGIFFPGILSAQDLMPEYANYVEQAQDNYIDRNYNAAVLNLSKAFQLLGNKGYPDDRYLAARCWSLLKNNDSAFYQLQRLADKTDFLTSEKLRKEPELDYLHNDPRWEKLMKQVNPQNEIYNDSLAKVLEKIYDLDQQYRNQLNKVIKKHGNDSPEMKAHWDTINYYDSINLAAVTAIIDKFGWSGPNTIGQRGNKTLWLVIQHAPLEVQEKYFPVMKTAVAKGNASEADLAYLEDRILMRQGKKQIYGTQYKLNKESGRMELWMIEDPEQVNERRKEVGLPPMEK